MWFFVNVLFTCLHPVMPVVHHVTHDACTIAHNNPAYAKWLKLHHLSCKQV
jgi:hypothetical protein